MAWRLAPSLAKFRDEINTRYPNRGKGSDGTIGDPAHAARTSDHNPDAQGIVRAFDMDEDLTGGDVDTGDEARAIVEHLRARRDPRIKYVIYSGELFSSYATKTRRPWTWGPYSGPNQHNRHVHISILPTDAAAENMSTWLAGMSSLIFAPPKEDIVGITYEDNQAFEKAVEDAAARGIARELETTGSRSRKALHNFLADKIAAPTDRLGQAVRRAVRHAVKGEDTNDDT